MPVLTARQAEEYKAGAAEKTVAPVFLKKESEGKKSEFIYYLQHPEHCVDFPIEGTVTLPSGKIPIVQGIVKTEDEEVKKYLLGVKWILLHTAKR